MNNNAGFWGLGNRVGPALWLGAVVAGAAFFALPAAASDVHVGISLGVALPNGYAEVHVGHDHYYEHRGVFYQHGPHGYVVVRAPRGAVVRVLPTYHSRIYVGRAVYYRYGNVYYQSCPGGYVVVDPPAMAALPPPPPVEDYQTVIVGQQEYQFKNGQFFTRTPDGLVWVKGPIGAVTQNLPRGARSVWYENVEYFESDDIFFRKTPEGYAVVEAPWKK